KSAVGFWPLALGITSRMSIGAEARPPGRFGPLEPGLRKLKKIRKLELPVPREFLGSTRATLRHRQVIPSLHGSIWLANPKSQNLLRFARAISRLLSRSLMDCRL